MAPSPAAPPSSPEATQDIVSSRSSIAAALAHFRSRLADGHHWFLALLEAMGHWTLAEEEHEGRHYCYLIEGEAFDYLLLAERLCLALASLLPSEEVEDLLFHGRHPLPVSNDELRRLWGPVRYEAYLNYFYGVTLEEALLLHMEERVWKERASNGSRPSLTRVADEAFRRLYGAPPQELLAQFLREKGRPATDQLALAEWKAFTYWLFKRRVRLSSKPKVASDTRCGLDTLLRHHELSEQRRRFRPSRSAEAHASLPERTPSRA